MDLSFEDIRAAVEDAQHISDEEKDDILDQLDELVDGEMPKELERTIKNILKLEAEKAEEEAEAAEAQLEKIDAEITRMESEQSPILQADLLQDFEAMDEAVGAYKAATSKIEADFEKGLEGEVEKGSQSEADDIRKKLGIA